MIGEREPQTLTDWQNHFREIYGANNNLNFPSRPDRIMWLGYAARKVQESHRKDLGLAVATSTLARVVPKIFSLAETVKIAETGSGVSYVETLSPPNPKPARLIDIPIVDGMVAKFPEGRCTYCHHAKCECNDVRPEPIYASPHESVRQGSWSLTDWQNHLNNMYGQRNEQKGFEMTMLHLFEEIIEVGGVNRDIATKGLTEENVDHLFIELGDCLAWTIAVANLSGVNLEQAMRERYLNGCWKCHRNPCLCEDVGYE